MGREFNDQQLVRRQKAEDLKTKGINPFGNAFKRTANSKTIKEEYDNFTKEELDEKKIPVVIAGRIMSKRRMGKMCFMHIQDRDDDVTIVYNSPEFFINTAPQTKITYCTEKSKSNNKIYKIEAYDTNSNDNCDAWYYIQRFDEPNPDVKPSPEEIKAKTTKKATKKSVKGDKK